MFRRLQHDSIEDDGAQPTKRAPLSGRHRHVPALTRGDNDSVSMYHALTMTVDVLLFASYAETLGGPRVTLELRPGATVNDVLQELRRLPGADRLPPAPMVAVNHRYARREDTVMTGDEIAVIPPVAGG